MNFAAIREEYQGEPLDTSTVHPDPIEQFRRWFDETLQAGIYQPNAMTLATATPDGDPSARMVLLKGFDAHGFVFFTNYLSRKGRELAANPRASLVFYWEELHRQVCIHGHVQPVSPAESEEYFQTRPYEARLGAAASHQSQPLPSRADFESAMAQLRAAYPVEIPRPEHWGGYRLTPDRIEFWQGRESRLHDRVQYLRTPSDTWDVIRLFP
ncbi:MAG: pyridoxamine 5'-phosphate oxidase [Acidobacteria bacterium]|nr:pyridoxamine 5'-phosphate oxidase [Acidobacteriota bacterium]